MSRPRSSGLITRFNPWMGCSKVSPGCDNCYAEALGKRTGRVVWGDDAERVLTRPAYWRNPVKWNQHAQLEGRRHRVFCASLADVFEDRDDVLDARERLFDLIVATPMLDWQLLTKRPENVLRFVPPSWAAPDCWPHNAWIGTTVEDQERAQARIPLLLELDAPVRFLSCEPLVGAVDLRPWLRRINDEARAASEYEWDVLHRVDWVIVGGESGPRYRPLDLDVARSIRDECQRWHVPFFFKQHGGRTPTAGGDLLDGERWHEFPSPLAV